MKFSPLTAAIILTAFVVSACDVEWVPEPDKNEAIQPLTLWSNTPARTRIIEFVEAVTNPRARHLREAGR